ncbi:Flavin-dependent oxidoreductase, luciferase family (includes alkanesulfonate monooxygenase SsuD and methylene tetrahydromethanopterin reductase) [Curtobacterium sp. UNCCL20]|uniref:LLM class flavin-dependent oxidoreductase n=1 Tax=Curtobacterium sp. UNCCL20 TaxID=1502773 RepID=UPI0008867F35|nr:LLM class flavin-dependent oxidoreductase [Curtobacterium sp. UNCCL20]SDR02536.1 Flavin-dependent oxidoreductase, luciferase family (includes alkanesulfonate monooxygenase SsuD and methylene tetrahydromethanopterin reductase) [Curtobacterium sp. UNCCL20]
MTTAPGRDAGLILGVNLQGFGQRPAAWRTQDVQPTDLLTAGFWGDLGRIAERGQLDMVFLADHPSFSDPNVRAYGMLEPFVALGAVADATTHLGLVGTASTTYNDPVELAERLLSLDTVSGGRVAWNAVTTYDRSVSANFGVATNPDRPERYARAGEVVDLVRALWRSAATGEPVEHHGEFTDEFRGAIAVPPSAQGHPVVFQAGGSPHGRDLAARVAEGVFAVELTPEPAREHYRAVKRAAATYGRDPADVAIVPGLSLVLGSTEAEAQRRFDELEALAPDGYALRALGTHLDADLTGLDPAAPIPAAILDREVDPVTYGPSLGYHETVVRWVRAHNTSLREVLRGFGGYGARIVVGTPEQAADTVEEWYRTGAADGFNLMIDEFPRGLETVVDELVPILQDRGVFHREYEDVTLRGRFAARRRPA